MKALDMEDLERHHSSHKKGFVAPAAGSTVRSDFQKGHTLPLGTYTQLLTAEVIQRLPLQATME